jgi:uncharacterized protein YodC (DUF2158 family)
MAFQAGDMVRHKAGGPEMVVDNVDPIFGVVCSFWDSKKNAKVQQTHSEASLVKVDAAGPGAAGESLAKRLEVLERRVGQLESWQQNLRALELT